MTADPTHAHAWKAWTVFGLGLQRFDAAEALFRRGLRICPTVRCGNHGCVQADVVIAECKI